MDRHARYFTLPVAMTLVALASAALPAQQRVPAPAEATPKQPTIVRLEFTGPDSGFPPRPMNATNVRMLDVAIRPLVTVERERVLRASAEADSRVRAALGRRFEFAGVSMRGEDKTGRTAPASVLMYYSYSRNIAVEVRVVGDAVAAVVPRPGYQPPETRDEIERAVALARQDSRIRGQVEGLEGDALVLPPIPGSRGMATRNRSVYVSFRGANEEFARYFAVVDLVADRVIAAGTSSRR